MKPCKKKKKKYLSYKNILILMTLFVKNNFFFVTMGVGICFESIFNFKY